MTLCISMMTADALVMGADSMTSVPAGNQLVTYANANKVYQIEPLPIVVMTYGLGALGRRTIQSLVEEWCDERPKYETIKNHTVRQVATDFSDWFYVRHAVFLEEIRAEFDRIRSVQRECEQKGAPYPPDVPQTPIADFNPMAWSTGLIIGGYQPDSHFPWLYARQQPNWPGESTDLVDMRPHQARADGADIGPPPGVNWWGMTAPVIRLVLGYEPTLFQKLRELGFATATDAEIREKIENLINWPVAYEGMPTKDAADFVRFLLRVGSGYEEFKAGLAFVGGGLDIAILSRKGVHWYSRKDLTEAMARR